MKHPETLGSAFLEAAAEPGLGVGFWTSPGRSEQFSYADLARDAGQVAAHLLAWGLKPSQRVGIILPTGPDFYRAFFGVVLAGGVPAAMYPPVRLGRIDEWKERTCRMMTDADTQAVLTDGRLLPLVSLPSRQAAPPLGCHRVSSLLSGAEAAPAVSSPGQLAAVQFSSGSTGRPKPVALSHRNMIGNSLGILSKVPGEFSEHSGMSWLPLYHDMGLIGCLLTAILARRPLTLMNPERFIARPRGWLEALTETRATISVAPNFAFGLCADRLAEDDLEGLDLSHWSVALCGAEPVHPRTLDRFAKQFAAAGFDDRAITPVYGLAEATLAVTFTPLEDQRQTTVFDPDALESEGRAVLAEDGLPLCSLGRPFLGTELEIRGHEGQALDQAQVGQVWVRGPGVMQGYLNQEALTSEILTHGWLDTGDRGFLYQGDLYLCGREKDVIIVRGRNYDPSVIEQGLDGVPGLRPGCWAALSVPTPEGDTEALILAVEARSRDDDELLEKACLAAVSAHSGLRADGVLILEPGTLPRTSSGKIRRSEARDRLLGGELLPAKRVTVLGVAGEMARGWYARFRSPRPR